MGDAFIILNILYYILLGLVCLRIVYDTDNSVKTLAYLVLAILIPVVGMLFYFSFGVNYRKRKIYNKKVRTDEALRKRIKEKITLKNEHNISDAAIYSPGSIGLVNLLINENTSPLTSQNRVDILLNGEEKFPELLESIRTAKNHIHIQYYIFENDTIGNQIMDLLIQKAREGVEVRFIYDDFGSHSIRKERVKQMRDAGVEAFPFNRIRLLFLANRINYRNHRKMVIIDGQIAYTGGINVADKYINEEGKPYWRDTHLRIEGPGIYYLQYQFFADWNFCAKQHLTFDAYYFRGEAVRDSNVLVQIAASGPDCSTSTIMLSLLKAIALAQKQILITTPYFIPGESVKDAIKVAALSGVKVKLLVPETADSKLVNAASYSYYTELLRSGVEVFLYQKGFIHAKTLVVDDSISIIGSANMDIRSFDLNFEVNTLIYDRETALQMTKTFEEDIRHAIKIDLHTWRNRPVIKRLSERFARLLSPML